VDGPAEHVDRHFRVGRDCLVADDHGLCLDLRVRVVSGDAVVVAGPSAHLRAGSHVTRRVEYGPAIGAFTLLVEETEETSPGRADAVLRFVSFEEMGDEHADHRFSYDAAAMSRLVDIVSAREIAGAPIRICDVSRIALAFISDDRFGRGENLDIAFTDEGGGMIHLRATVTGPERATYGRVHHVARIIAIAELDQQRLDRLCSRCRLRDEAASVPATENAALRSLLVPEPSALRRAFGKR
jgi:hypothetical protein